MRTVSRSFVAIVFLAAAAPPLHAQGRGGQDLTQLRARRDSLEKELEAIAVIDRKLMVPMRDGRSMQFDVYRPKNVAEKCRRSSSRTPYNLNFWDVRNGAPADMTAQLDAVKRGYAYVGTNERGHFFSEGNYDILGPPLTDGVRRDPVDLVAAMVQRQGRSDRLLIDRGVADGASPRRRRRDSRRSSRRDSALASAASSRTTSRATGIVAARCRCCSSTGSRASRIRCGRCSRRIRRRQI